MIDLYLLQELVAFNKYGTLAKTAEKLAVTQPTVTRGMQKLETKLGVKLFNREPNRIILTEVGKYAARKAQIVIEVNEDYAEKIKQFALSEQEITIAANAPGPLIELETLPQKNIKISHQLVSKHFADILLNEQENLLLLNQEIHTQKIESIYLGTENLYVHLNEFTDLANRSTVKFDELKNKSFLVFYDIGIWRQIIQDNIPGAKFIYQNNVNNFTEIKNNSIFPYFTTNITKLNPNYCEQKATDRIKVKITDKAAKQQFYACFLKKNKKRLLPLIQQLQDKWAEID